MYLVLVIALFFAMASSILVAGQAIDLGAEGQAMNRLVMTAVLGKMILMLSGGRSFPAHLFTSSAASWWLGDRPTVAGPTSPSSCFCAPGMVDIFVPSSTTRHTFTKCWSPAPYHGDISCRRAA